MPVIVASVAIVVMAGLAILADRAFVDHDRLPMQWGLDGAVNWSAPRRIALSFMPLLGLLVMPLAVFHDTLGISINPADTASAVAMLAATFVAVQLLHLGLIRWTLRK